MSLFIQESTDLLFVGFSASYPFYGNLDFKEGNKLVNVHDLKLQMTDYSKYPELMLFEKQIGTPSMFIDMGVA